MKEQYVTYQTAKLLKEKGFDWLCDKIYRMRDEYLCPIEYCLNYTEEPHYLAPTQQMACSWLREEHKIFISIGIGTDMDNVFGYMPEIYFLDTLDCDMGMYGPNVDADTICDFTPQTPEEAIEATLVFVLTNLI